MAVLQAADHRVARLPALRVVIVSLSCFAAVTALVSLRATPPWTTLPLLLVALVAVPTADTLAARVALNGCLLIGWTPMMWMVRWPIHVDHAAVLLGLGAAVVGGAIAREPDPHGQRARLVPRVRPVDAMMGVSALVALFGVHRLLLVRGPQSALNLLLTGYDNVAHFDMFHVLLQHGATLDVLGRAPDGSAWAYDHYPQGFPALLGTFTELATPASSSGPDLLVPYCRAVAAVVVLGAVVLTAALCALPQLEDRLAIALPVVGISLTALLWEPGAHVIFDGFVNFWLAAVMAACGLLLSLSLQERATTIEVAAVVGAVMSVALTWTPLVFVAWIAVAVVSGVFRRDGWSTGRPLAARLLVLAVGGLVVLRECLVLVSTVSVSEILDVGGGIHIPEPVPLLLVVVSSLYVCASSRGWVRRLDGRLPPHVVHRMRLASLAPLSAVLLAVLLLVSNLRASGVTSYYFVKLCTGIELILVPLLAGVLGVLVAATTSRSPRRTRRTVAAVALVVVGTQIFGFVRPSSSPVLHAPPWMADRNGVPLQRPAIAHGVLAAVAGTPPSRSSETDYLALGTGRDAVPLLPATWFHSLDGGLTEGMTQRIALLVTSVSDGEDSLPVVHTLLDTHPSVQVVVPVHFLPPLRRQLEPALADRVVGW